MDAIVPLFNEQRSGIFYAMHPREGEVYMREKHATRVSKLILLIHVITTIFVCMGLMSQLKMAADMSPVQSILPMIVTLVVFIGGIICFATTKGSIVYVRYVAISYSIAYAVMLVTAANGNAFPYIIPFLLVFMMSMDKLALRFSAIAMLAVNLIRVVLTMATNEDVTVVLENVMIEMIIVITVMIASMRGIVLLQQFFNDSMKEVALVADKNETMAQKIIEVAARVEENTVAMSKAMDDVLQGTSTVSDSMNDVSAEMTDTAEVITDQTLQTQEIQKTLDETHSATSEIVNITANAEQALREGTSAMNDLFGYVNESIESSFSLQAASSALQEKSNEVLGITDIIFGISGKTNLLALNASIEAARAGEAGRGFAVVAEEIRELAEQTRKETENISAIVDELSIDARKMMESVQQNVDMANKESELARTAYSRFEVITERMEILANCVGDVDRQVSSLLTANNAIVDSVCTLSAHSEEISAKSIEAYDLSTKNLNLVNETRDLQQMILEEVQELHSYAE